MSKLRLIRRAILVCLLAFTCIPASAELQAGIDAIKTRDFETALIELLPVAHAGDALAQTLIANMYRRGYGVQRDYAQAVSWYQRAAYQGYPSAQYNLGVHLREGLGISSDDEAALVVS